MHEPFEYMVTAIVRTGEHVQTMGRQAPAVVFSEMISSLIAIVTASLREPERRACSWTRWWYDRELKTPHGVSDL